MDKEQVERYQEDLAKVLESYMDVLFSKDDNSDLKFQDFVEKPMYLAAMRHCLGNQTKVQKKLGVSQQKLRDRLDKYFKTRKVGYQFADIE